MADTYFKSPYLVLNFVLRAYFQALSHVVLKITLFFFFLGPQVQHVEVPRLGVELELQLPTYAIATAT